jgi:hypothetical protein
MVKRVDLQYSRKYSASGNGVDERTGLAHCPSHHAGQGPKEDFAHLRARQALLRKEKRFYPRPLDRVAFEGVTADLLVLGKHDPAPLTGSGEPVNIGRVFREMIVVDFYARVCITQCLCDYPLAKAAINEEND